MDYYKEYDQTTNVSTVYSLKNEGWEVIKTHVEFYGDGSDNSKTVFTLGLPYKVVAEKLNSILKDIEDLGFKDEIVKKVADKYGEDLNEYDYNSYFTTNNKFTKWVSDYEKNVHGKEVTLGKKVNEEF